MKKLLLFIFPSFLFFCSCQQNPAINYSFFVAGHAYGSPQIPADVLGLHPPFVKIIDSLNQQESLAFGIFTGDIARQSRTAVWDSLATQLKQLNVPYYIAPGNHDNSTSKLYQERNGANYFSFVKENDLFLILDGNLDDWNIGGAQLDFFKKELAQVGQYRHLFIFVHQLIWWQAEGEWSLCQPNSFQGKAKELTFHTKILPLLQKLDNDVFIFAGDVGAVPKSEAICGIKKHNMTFIASGMGIKAEDNILLVEVDSKGQTHLNLIGLKCQSDLKCLGEIANFFH